MIRRPPRSTPTSPLFPYPTLFRSIHFATHVLVTAPRPACPARPALVTSFGGGDSDGLLTFQEIFDLRIDADLVILSACDTAGAASVAATRAAGLSGGGSRSEERRVGKECFGTCNSRVSPYH